MLRVFGRPVISVPMLSRLAKAAFFAALAFTFYSAVIPPQRALQLVPWDKAEHFIAFYTLTGLAAAAFPRRHILVIALLLSGFGALIEVVQGLPIVHRDEDFWDWVADSLAVAAALAPMLLVAWRRVAVAPATATPRVATPDQKNIDM
jgi:hypothetical protein